MGSDLYVKSYKEETKIDAIVAISHTSPHLSIQNTLSQKHFSLKIFAKTSL